MVGEHLTVNGIELEVLRRCAGRSTRRPAGGRCCCCTAWTRFTRTRRFSIFIGSEAEIIAPSSPGFGSTQRPPDFDTIYDLVHLYLALIDELPFEKIALIGLSFGGWLAAEIAVACSHKLDRLILADPVGIKLGDRETRDIARRIQLNPARGAPPRLARPGESAGLR